MSGIRGALFFSRPTDDNSLGVPKIRRRPSHETPVFAFPLVHRRRLHCRPIVVVPIAVPIAIVVVAAWPADKKIMDRRDPVSHGRRTSTGSLARINLQRTQLRSNCRGLLGTSFGPRKGGPERMNQPCPWFFERSARNYEPSWFDGIARPCFSVYLDFKKGEN